MVVLGVITREIAASLGFRDDHHSARKWCSKQERCALKIKERLQSCFSDDDRFHKTDRRGRTTEGEAIGYVIFLCFSYLDKRRSRAYSFYLCDLSFYESTDDVVSRLARQIDDATSAIERGTGREIRKLYIGKTNVRSWRGRDFDRMDPDTFSKEGISGRRSYHKKKDYGRDGMVVLGVITRKIAASLGFRDDHHSARKWIFKQERCALKIEEQLQSCFSYDRRFSHKTYHQGKTSKREAIGYVIYLCFSYRDKRRA